jgi:hypothetical protein
MLKNKNVQQIKYSVLVVALVQKLVNRFKAKNRWRAHSNAWLGAFVRNLSSKMVMEIVLNDKIVQQLEASFQLQNRNNNVPNLIKNSMHAVARASLRVKTHNHKFVLNNALAVAFAKPAT